MYQPLVIRFWRKGASDYPVYDIVVTPKAHRYRGAFIERIGHYNPNGREKIFLFDGQRLGYWLNRGATLHNKITLHLPTEYSLFQAFPKVVSKILQRRKEKAHLLAEDLLYRRLQRQRKLQRQREEARRRHTLRQSSSATYGWPRGPRRGPRSHYSLDQRSFPSKTKAYSLGRSKGRFLHTTRSHRNLVKS